MPFHMCDSNKHNICGVWGKIKKFSEIEVVTFLLADLKNKKLMFSLKNYEGS